MEDEEIGLSSEQPVHFRSTLRKKVQEEERNNKVSDLFWGFRMYLPSLLLQGTVLSNTQACRISCFIFVAAR